MTDINVADYRVIRDAPVTLTHNGTSEKSFGFNLPDDIPSNSNGCVWWVDRNTGGNDHVDYVVTLNGDDIRPAPPPFYRVEAPFFYTRHETFSAERLNAGAANTLEVRVLDGAGTLEVADFILAFKKTIDD
jgi:hypothetical protein